MFLFRGRREPASEDFEAPLDVRKVYFRAANADCVNPYNPVCRQQLPDKVLATAGMPPPIVGKNYYVSVGHLTHVVVRTRSIGAKLRASKR